MTKKIESEITKFKKLQSLFQGKDTGQGLIDVNLQDYFDFTMKEGSVFEKRSILECLDNKIIIRDKKNNC
jgi:hypothetical protein